MNLRATMLDDAAWFVPFMETFAHTRLPWAQTGARHSFDAFPDPADYPRLMAEFADGA